MKLTDCTSTAVRRDSAVGASAAELARFWLIVGDFGLDTRVVGKVSC
jgi:hypothetical protein